MILKPVYIFERLEFAMDKTVCRPEAAMSLDRGEGRSDAAAMPIASGSTLIN